MNVTNLATTAAIEARLIVLSAELHELALKPRTHAVQREIAALTNSVTHLNATHAT